MEKSILFDKVYGTLIGGLIGDAMGAPSEGKTWKEIEEHFGLINDFQGAGTDDSAIKQILCEAIIENNGYITRDEFAASFLRNAQQYYNLFFIPVRNMLHKLKSGLVKPVDAGQGNMLSSSSAMAISPIGIINACNPRQAALEAFEAAGLMHAGSSGFCRDAASSVAAAVAEAFNGNATVDSIISAATSFLHQTSAFEMISEIKKVVKAAKEIGNYEGFRDWFYSNCLRDIICDSRETVPCMLALFYLAEGEPERSIVYSANFGRDSDTIGTMAGALAGAFKGASGIRSEWVEKVESAGNTVLAVSSDAYHIDPIIFKDQKVLAEKIMAVIIDRNKNAKLILASLDTIL